MATEFKVLTAEEYQELKQDLACMRKLFTDAVSELKQLKDNKLMSVAEVCEFSGYGEAWVLRNKDKIGFSQATGSLRFFKEDVIAFFKNSNHYIKSK